MSRTTDMLPPSLVRIVLLLLLVPSVLAYQAIAHRGLFHDVNDNYRLAENSVDALYRANAFGLAGVELDLRLTSDGVVMVTHDIISNRATAVDNYRGRFNPIDAALNLQPSVAPVYINAGTFLFWNHRPLKVYGGEGHILPTISAGVQKLESLDAMLQHYKDLNSNHLSLYLDIQDPLILAKAGPLVKKYALDDKVYLKFFATKAIDSSRYKYAGPATCHQYAVDNGFSGLRVIPQFNDGEMTFKNNIGYIRVFQTELTVEEYLSCWAGAQTSFGLSAARLDMVSASVPYGNSLAWHTSTVALNWAKLHGRRTMSIQPNPDAGRRVGDSCQFWTFQSNAVKAAIFDDQARKAKLFFVQTVKPDFVVVDLMGDLTTRTWTDDFSEFTSHFC